MKDYEIDISETDPTPLNRTSYRAAVAMAQERIERVIIEGVEHVEDPLLGIPRETHDLLNGMRDLDDVLNFIGIDLKDLDAIPNENRQSEIMRKGKKTKMRRKLAELYKKEPRKVARDFYNTMFEKMGFDRIYSELVK